MESDCILTEREAADRLYAKPPTLTKWRARGRGPAYLKLSGKIRYRLSDIEKFIESSRVDPAAVEPGTRPRQRRRRISPKR
jgi:hypothetical protein